MQEKANWLFLLSDSTGFFLELLCCLFRAVFVYVCRDRFRVVSQGLFFVVNGD